MAESTSAVEQIVADAQAADKLAEQKSAAQGEIDNMTYLTDDEKSAYNQQISDATDVAGVNAVVDDATDQNLASAKETATTEISNLANLSETDQTTYTDQVNQATDVATVEQAVTDAKQAADSALAEAQKDATATIDNLSYLSSNDQTDFKQQIANTENVADIEPIVTEATDQNLVNAKTDASTEIDGLQHLTDDKKQSFVDQISNADTVATVEQIVADAKLADALAQQQAEAETQIDEMVYLSDDEKASYKNHVATATTSDEIATIIDEAEATNLANAKDWAHDEISDLTNLSASLASSFNSEASDSDTVAEVEEVVDEATAANEQPEAEQTAEGDSVPTSNASTTTGSQNDATVAVDATKNVTTNDGSMNNVVAAPLPLSNAQVATVGTATGATDMPVWNGDGTQNNVITPMGETAADSLPTAVDNQMTSSNGDVSGASNPYVATASSIAGTTGQGQAIDDRIVYNGSSKEVTDGRANPEETDEQTEKSGGRTTISCWYFCILCDVLGVDYAS
ncbi:hypothetical protein ACDP95_00775 [Weissella confusa]